MDLAEFQSWSYFKRFSASGNAETPGVLDNINCMSSFCNLFPTAAASPDFPFDEDADKTPGPKAVFMGFYCFGVRVVRLPA